MFYGLWSLLWLFLSFLLPAFDDLFEHGHERLVGLRLRLLGGQRGLGGFQDARILVPEAVLPDIRRMKKLSRA
jgi:hypothetical protein